MVFEMCKNANWAGVVRDAEVSASKGQQMMSSVM
jgi:hypothetical protein